MNIILDKYGKEHQVTGLWYLADMRVMILAPEDIPIACSATNLDNGKYLEWEDEEYKYMDSLDKIHDFETGGKTQWDKKNRGFRLLSYTADYFVAVIYPEGEAVLCAAIKPNGEQVCRWTRSDFRGSMTAWAWSFGVYGYILETQYLTRGVDRMWGLVHTNNIISNKYYLSVGARLVDKVIVNGADFNKYEQDIVGIVAQAKRLAAIWIDNRLGDISKPSIAIQKLNDKQAINV
jgi:hypothetical protein